MKTQPVLLTVAVLLAACDFSFPLGAPETAVFDERLLGRWWAVEGEDPSDTTRVWVRRAAGGAQGLELDIEVDLRDLFSTERTTVQLRGHLVPVAGARFLNARVLDPEEGDGPEWLILRVEHPEPGALRVRALKADARLRSMRDPEALRAFLARSVEDPSIYEEEVRYHRVEG